MRFIIFLVMVGFVGVSAAMFNMWYKEQSRQVELRDYGQAPYFKLQDSSGSEFDSAALRGKVWLVNLFFTSCPDVCPAINSRLAAIHRMNLGSNRLHMVSISVDPERDTPDVLKEYAKRFSADASSWHFLRGEAPQIRDIITEQFKLASGDELTLHTTQLVLVDQRYRIRGYFDGSSDQSAAKLSAAIRQLISSRTTPPVQAPEDLPVTP